MNTNRTNWSCNISHINITPNWLLGYLEGDGSFYIGKGKEANFTLFFAIAQTRNDLPLMKAIQDYLNALNS